MPSIAITVKQDTSGTWRADNTANARVINGNSDYYIALTFEGSGWGAQNTTLYVTEVGTEGGQTTRTITTTSTAAYIPTVNNAYLLRVEVERNGRRTRIPALIFCDACITDDSGSTETLRRDVYNLMTQCACLALNGDRNAADAVLATLTALRETAPPAFPGDAYRLAATRSERATRMTGKIKIGSTVHEFTDDDIMADSLTITTNVMNDVYLLPGGCPSAELRIGLLRRTIPDDLDGAEIELTYHILRHDDIWCDIPLGTFTVASHDNTERGYQIMAYDDMKKLGDIPLSQILYRRGGVNTPREILLLILQASGLRWDGVWPFYPGTWQTTSWNIDKAGTAIETAWDLFAYLLQGCGFVAYIDRFRTLRMKALKKTDSVARYAAGEMIRSSVSKIAYTQAALGTSYTYTDDHTGEIGTGRYLFDTFYEDGVTVYMSENPLWNGVINWDRIPTKQAVAGLYLSFVAEAISQCVYKPGEITVHGDPAIDVTDWITVETPAGDVDYPITNTNWQYRGEHTLAAVGVEAIAGVGRTQAEKKALSAAERSASSWQFLSKNTTLQVIRASGHRGMSGYTHAWLHLFRHEQFEEIIAQEGTS